jgi:superoxide dismutase, Fe-Mn family
MAYTLMTLPYPLDALEPYIDKETMALHHGKHHQTYVNKLNEAVANHPELQSKSPQELITNLNAIPEAVRNAVRNHGGGVYNHDFFWSVLKKDVKFSGDIADAINAKFGGYDKFKELFSAAAAGVFGSGWAWLVESGGNLEIIGLPNQDSPLSQGKTPLLAIDVWEHAYYLKYQNRRPDYIGAFFSVINWDQVNRNFLAVKRVSHSGAVK